MRHAERENRPEITVPSLMPNGENAANTTFKAIRKRLLRGGFSYQAALQCRAIPANPSMPEPNNQMAAGIGAAILPLMDT